MRISNVNLNIALLTWVHFRWAIKWVLSCAYAEDSGLSRSLLKLVIDPAEEESPLKTAQNTPMHHIFFPAILPFFGLVIMRFLSFFIWSVSWKFYCSSKYAVSIFWGRFHRFDYFLSISHRTCFVFGSNFLWNEHKHFYFKFYILDWMFGWIVYCRKILLWSDWYGWLEGRLWCWIFYYYREKDRRYIIGRCIQVVDYFCD